MRNLRETNRRLGSLQWLGRFLTLTWILPWPLETVTFPASFGETIVKLRMSWDI